MSAPSILAMNEITSWTVWPRSISRCLVFAALGRRDFSRSFSAVPNGDFFGASENKPIKYNRDSANSSITRSQIVPSILGPFQSSVGSDTFNQIQNAISIT
jgi:hypothetical protein